MSVPERPVVAHPPGGTGWEQGAERYAEGVMTNSPVADDLPFGWGTEVEAGRYRLSPWHEQVDSCGCVGIDITEEAAALHDGRAGRPRLAQQKGTGR